MSQFFTPRNLLRILWRRAVLILLVLAICLPLSVWFALRQAKLFEAIAVIQIEAPEVTDVALRAANATTSNDGQLDLIQQKLMSRDHMTDVIERLNLYAGTDLSPTERVGQLRGAVEISKLIDPAAAFRPDVQASGLIITVRMEDAEEAAAVANDFLDAILTAARTRSEGRTARTLEFFVSEEARVEAEILAAESELSEFKEANGPALPDNILNQQTRLLNLRETAIDLDQQLIALETSNERVRPEEAERQQNLVIQQRALIEDNIADIEAALAAAPEVERQLSAMTRRLEQLETEFQAITVSRSDAAMQQLIESQDQAERYEVLETAIVPETPVSTSRAKLAIAGGVASGLLALGLALLLEFSNPVIRNAAQLEAQLGIRPIVTIPHLRSRVQRRRRRMWVVALLLALIGALASVAWWFKDRLGELLGTIPFQRTTGRA